QSFDLWKKIAGLPESRIIRIAGSDNFWAMGDTGPCGPCSEIFYDHGDKIAGGPPGSADADGDRFAEIWNLVFMQFEQLPGGARDAGLLGAREPLMWKLVPTLTREMGQAYPELHRAEALIAETLKLEESRFRKTLERGLTILDAESANLKRGDKLKGETAFTL